CYYIGSPARRKRVDDGDGPGRINLLRPSPPQRARPTISGQDGDSSRADDEAASVHAFLPLGPCAGPYPIGTRRRAPALPYGGLWPCDQVHATRCLATRCLATRCLATMWARTFPRGASGRGPTRW